MTCFKIDVEIPMFLLLFCTMLNAPVSTNLLLYRTCYVTLGYNESECALLGSKHANTNTTDLEKLVQPQANIIGMTRSLIGTFISIFICIFVGPWSDTNGRKPVLLSSLFGEVLNYFAITIYCCFTYASPWFLMFGSLGVFFGGLMSFITVSVSYITDVTPEENRAMRMGVFGAAVPLGMLLGTFLSSYLFAAVGYVFVFAICTGCMMLGFLFTLFFIKESVSFSESEVQHKKLLSLTHVKDIVMTILKKREMFNRKVLICTICILTLSAFVASDGSVLFMYVRGTFNWSLEKYTLFSSVTTCISIIGMIPTVYILHNMLHVPEAMLLLIGCISLLSGSIIMGLAKQDWLLYVGAVVKILSSALGPMGQSLISKTVHQNEIGKIMTLMMILDVLGTTIAVPLYTFVYNATINSMPGLYNFISAGFYFIGIVMAIMLIALRNLQKSYSQGSLLQERSTEQTT